MCNNMPFRKSVPSLQTLCLRYVSSNLDVWCGEEDNTISESDDNHITCLPVQVINNIRTHAIRGRHIRRHHVNSLMHGYTGHLDFFYCHVVIHRFTNQTDCFCFELLDCTKHAINLISSSVCANFTSLNLSYCTISPDYLEKLAKSIPLIEFLNLKHTKTNDIVVAYLGKNCPKLLELDIRKCSDVTDTGMHSLCVEGICQSIVKLRVLDSSVYDEGTKTAIINLPNLRYFDYENSLKMIEDIYVENNLNGRRFKLETVSYSGLTNERISNALLDAAIILCPNVSKVELLLETKPTDEWLLKLVGFCRIEELSLCGRQFYRSMIILIYKQVAPVLRIIGSNLKSLSLMDVDEVNLLDVGLCCPRLSRLYLCQNYSYTPRTQLYTNITKIAFSELRELVVRCGTMIDIPSEQLCDLLTNCTKLRILNFDNCQSITDDLLSRVVKCNSFSELRVFVIRKCNNIHASSILSLLRISKSLKQIKCFKCAGLCDNDLVELQVLAREENLDFTVSSDFTGYLISQNYVKEASPFLLVN